MQCLPGEFSKLDPKFHVPDESRESRKNRAVIERTINHFKEPMACGNPKTRNLATIKCDMLLAGITQLITVILADKMNNYELIRSLKPLIA